MNKIKIIWGNSEMETLLSMFVKFVMALLCIFALVETAIPQVIAASNPQKVSIQYHDYVNSYDAVQDERMTAMEASLAALQKICATHQTQIESLIENESRWMGGLQTIFGLIAFSSVVGLGLQIHEKLKVKK